MIRNDSLLYFKAYTKYDLKPFLNRVLEFNNIHRNNITTYFLGQNKNIKESFQELNYLITELDVILNLFTINRENFKTFDFWNLIEELDQLKTKFVTLTKLPKYLRSTNFKNTFSINRETYLKLKTGGTLEKLSKFELFSENFDNDWVQLAIDNSLNEEAYSTKGGVLLKASFPVIKERMYLESVVGLPLKEYVDLSTEDLIEKQLCGVDLNKKITFVDDDLEVLSPKDTLNQTIDILLNIKRGNIPEYPNLGINSSFLVGSNIGSLTFPILFREISNVFGTDDTIQSISLNDISINQDVLFCTFSILTTYGVEIKKDRSIDLSIKTSAL